MAIVSKGKNEAALVLADGSVHLGESVGATGLACGETVFNTSMTGYQEMLSDPSYTGQLLTLTTAHVGNTGVTEDDMESAACGAAGLIVNAMTMRPSNWRAEKSLPDFLKEKGVVAIAGVDTRALTTLIRQKGAMPGAIVAVEGKLTADDIEKAKAQAQGWGSMAGRDLASEVTCKAPYVWREGLWVGPKGEKTQGFEAWSGKKGRVLVWDFGVKRNILRSLVSAGLDVTVVPAKTTFEEAQAYKPDGFFFSNGPGDPEACTYAIETVKKALAAKVPLFGICLGHQILGLAAGGKTVKMKAGHHGGNHPVLELSSGRVAITSQNHGFAVDADTLPANVRVTHVSLFDGTVQGIELTDRPAFGFQGHPEAAPGPQDLAPLFERFAKSLFA